MNIDELEKRLDEIKQKTIRLLRFINNLEILYKGQDYKEYERECLKAALQAEKIACTIRNIIFASTEIPHVDLMKLVLTELKFNIHRDSYGFRIEIPGLIPKRKQSNSSKFLIDPLYSFLNIYCSENQVIKFKECVVCFIHNYNQKLPERRIRDYDNLELKQILDVITTFFLEDDSGKLCDMFNATTLGEKDYTCIYIMEKSIFPVWIKNQSRTLLIG